MMYIAFFICCYIDCIICLFQALTVIKYTNIPTLPFNKLNKFIICTSIFYHTTKHFISFIPVMRYI